MSPTKPTAHKTSDAPKKQRVFPADFAEFVAATAAALGDGWAVDTDDKPHPGPSAYLAHPDGRRIGIKHLWRGEAVQTWALNVPPREFEEGDRDTESYADSLKHLSAGIRYNVGVCFTANPPATTAAQRIRARLLPAFDGERPPLRAFPKKTPRRAPGAEKNPAAANAPTSGDTPKPEQATTTKKAPAKPPRPTAKKTQTPAKATEPKKRTPAPRSRRATTTAKATKAQDAEAKKSKPTEAATSN
ncbi:hypothetical protein [Streptomyces sp. MUM 2J]|uniref:hypothetical protein n=1 Tax=Streptomyces sp. MUM 2J TaxID=2791987 RepID=UPI001F04E845|nr:hypothetical protein [Streptomyces sp. MUM 2J]MCH0562108.1 hypothetical protein [Streptomyces sp. MUM 2J]